jgi:hypothetical protein
MVAVATGIFEDFGDDRLQFTAAHGTNNQGNNINANTTGNYNNQHLPVATATIVSTTNPQQQQTKLVHPMGNQGGGYYPTAIHANYAITPAPTNAQGGVVGGAIKGRPQTLVVQRHVGQQKLFSVGGTSNC